MLPKYTSSKKCAARYTLEYPVRKARIKKTNPNLCHFRGSKSERKQKKLKAPSVCPDGKLL
jgi:hypothetical protein